MVQVVAISGASGSGKSTLAAAIVSKVGSDVAAVLPLDAYYHDLGHLRPADREQVNFDHPDALDLPLFREHVMALKSGLAVRRPDYDFFSHCRRKESVRLAARPLIVVEGILVAADPVLREFYDLLVFVEAESKLRWERRLLRDQIARGRSAVSIARFWERAEVNFEAFGVAARHHADCIVRGEALVEDNVKTVLGCLRGPLPQGEG